MLEALLQSTLECFYQKFCLNLLILAVQSQSSVNATVLDLNRLKHFDPDTKIAFIVDELMVEEWNHNVIYEQYYATCQPTECSYTVTSRHDKVYIITTLFSLIGGLITAFKFCIPRLVLLIGKLYRRITTSHPPSGKYLKILRQQKFFVCFVQNKIFFNESVNKCTINLVDSECLYLYDNAFN